MSLHYLMTSNFDEKMTPVQMRELLLEFRKEYRLLDAKLTQTNRENTKQFEKIVELKQVVNSTQKQLFNLMDKYNATVNRKLTFKERMGGKILNK